MTEEIKEILENIKKQNEWEGVEYFRTPLSNEDADKLLKCITNLQQEKEEYSMIFDTFSKRPYAHKYLEEKKKKLNNNKIIGLDSEMVYKDYYDYKSRCEKANKIITDFMCTEEYCSVDPVAIAENYTEIQKALNGSDENE